MSYSFEGKLANQKPTITNLTSAKTKCGKCNRTMEAPIRSYAKLHNKFYLTFSYLESEAYIYETKAGIAITYCSKYCRDKHNHRFTKA